VLGLTGVLGLGTRGQTFANLQRDGECVLNLPSVDQAAAVDRLALTTGMDPVPGYKKEMGFRHVKDKFAEAGLSAGPSDLVRPSRVMTFPINWRRRSPQFIPSVRLRTIRRASKCRFFEYTWKKSYSTRSFDTISLPTAGDR